MVISTAFIAIAVLIGAIWVIIEVKRLKHKLFAILLIGMILFSYISFATIFKDTEIDYKTIPGITEIGKIYFSWLYSLFGNFKILTTNAIKMDWGINESLEIQELK